MREILYRGKRVDNGEWVYGIPWLFSPPVDKAVIIYAMGLLGEDEDDTSRYCECFEVDVSTVGQFTGLTDKNGKKIFEGDILEQIYDGDVIRPVIVWGDSGWAFKEGEFVDDLIEGSAQCKWYEVIGNIHDDYELLDNSELLEDKP